MMSDIAPKPDQQQQLNIEIDDKTAEGMYSNLAIINHSPAEFVLDFTRVLPGVLKARVQSRIIMTPQHAKMFLAAMQENVRRYEQSFGEIKIVGSPDGQQMGFHSSRSKNDVN